MQVVARSSLAAYWSLQEQLAEIFGSRLLASEALSGDRRMTLEMIRAVVAAWRIPAELLIGDRIVQNSATAEAG